LTGSYRCCGSAAYVFGMESTSSSGEIGREDMVSPVLERDISVPLFSSSMNEPIVTDSIDSATAEKKADLNTGSTGYDLDKKGNTEMDVEVPDVESESKQETSSNLAGGSSVNFNLETVDMEKTETSPEKSSEPSNYVSEFHKFLQKENAAHAAESEISTGLVYDEKGTNRTVSNVQDNKITKPFHPISEETSNSSWYKLKPDENEQLRKMDTVTVDETSNLSLADNASCASSNIGEGLHFHDQTSNLDDCSNLSIPDENSVTPYAGHQPVFDESANMNPPSNLPSATARPDTPNSEKDKNASESTPAKKFRRGTLQIAADDANEHGQ